MQSVSASRASRNSPPISCPALKGPNGQSVTVPKIYPNNESRMKSDSEYPLHHAESASPRASHHQCSSAGSTRYDTRYPFDGTDQVENITDNVSWIKGRTA